MNNIRCLCVCPPLSLLHTHTYTHNAFLPILLTKTRDFFKKALFAFDVTLFPNVFSCYSHIGSFIPTSYVGGTKLFSERMTASLCPCWISCRLPDSSSDKENSLSRAGLPLHRPVSHRASVQSDPPASAPPTHRRFDYVELSPVPASAAPLSANQREAGEGQGREHSQWQEERTSSSQWEALLSRKGSGAGSNRVEEEIEKKWAEFETLPLRDMSSRPTLGSWASKQSANEALQREVVCGEVFPICIER